MFEVGQKVMFVAPGRCHFPEFFPEPGTIGEVVFVDDKNRGCWVNWPEGSLTPPEGTENPETWPHEFKCPFAHLERVEE